MRLSGPELFDRFRAYERDSTGSLREVRWDSEWKEIRPFMEKRKGERRGHVLACKVCWKIFRDGSRFYAHLKCTGGIRRSKKRRNLPYCKLCRKHFPNGPSFAAHRICPNNQTRKERRDPLHSKERRNPRRCDICLEVFPDVYSLGGHLPCRVNEERVDTGFVDLIAEARQRPGPSGSEVGFLRNVIRASLSESAFNEASKSLYFRADPKASREDNYKRYRAEWFLCFVALIRPEEIEPKTVNHVDRRECLQIEEAFMRASEDSQEKIIRQLFDSSFSLEEIARTGRTPKLQPSDLLRKALSEDVRMPPRKWAKYLTTLRVQDWAPQTPEEAYHDNPSAFANQLRRYERCLGLKRR